MSDTALLSVVNMGLSFLGRNTAVSKRLGAAESNNISFYEADQSDRDSHEIGKFRGINPSSPFYTQPIGKFRGIYQQPKSYNSHYDPLVARQPASRLEYILDFFGIRLETKTSETEAVENQRLTEPDDRVYLNTDNAIYDLLTEPGDLNEAYVNVDETPGQTQEDELAAFTEEVIDHGIENSTWRAHPDLARLILENRGELADKLEESENLRDLITTSPDEVLLEASRERVREQVSEKLKNSADILDQDFLEEYPLVALRLLERPDLVSWVEENRDNALQLRADAGRITKEMQDRLAEEADSLVQNLPFTEDFFAANPNLAEAVWADTLTGYDQSIGTWLESKASLLPEDANMVALASGYWADRAKTATGGAGTIPEHLFDNNPPLSMMAALDQDVADSLAAEATAIQTMYPLKTSTSLPVLAYRAFGLGLGNRYYGDYQRVA